MNWYSLKYLITFIIVISVCLLMYFPINKIETYIRSVKFKKDIKKRNTKAIFFEKLQPFFDEKIIRIAYSSDIACILSLKEVFYVACPYVLSRTGAPVGVYIKPDRIKKTLKNELLIYKSCTEAFKDPQKNIDIIFIFDEVLIENYHKTFSQFTTKGSSEIDPDLEKEINKDKN